MNNRGAVLLMSVIIIGAVSLAVTSALLLAGIDNSIVSQEINQGSKASATSEACVEEGLLALGANPGLTGTFNETIQGSACSYTVSSSSGGTGQTYTIRAVAINNGNTKRTEVNLSQVSPTVVITDWNTNANF